VEPHPNNRMAFPHDCHDITGARDSSQDGRPVGLLQAALERFGHGEIIRARTPKLLERQEQDSPLVG